MSGDETKAITEVAKATGEVAKLSGKAIDAATGFANWVGKTIGTIPEDLLGIAGGDWLHEQRRRNLISLQAKTAEIRTRIYAGPPQEPSVSVVLPLLRAASDEARPELQSLWAGLLTAALQPDGGRRVRRAYFDTLAQMEPLDAVLFEAIMHLRRDKQGGRVDANLAGGKAGIGGDERTVSINALEKLGLIVFGHHDGLHAVKPYGLAFWEACNPQLF
ncbi:MAG: DUF4393 domain-containing protein [Roseomonas sp.]|nr:DUF4393 domain-containing protein [Roseomonas sp.]